MRRSHRPRAALAALALLLAVASIGGASAPAAPAAGMPTGAAAEHDQQHDGQAIVAWVAPVSTVRAALGKAPRLLIAFVVALIGLVAATAAWARRTETVTRRRLASWRRTPTRAPPLLAS